MIGSMGQWIHRLSNINPEAGTCDCAACGDGVRLKVRIRKDKPQYLCHEAALEKDRKTRAERDRRYGTTARRKIGVTPADFAIMLTSQNGLCAICGTTMSKPYVDHCHSTGRVRGLLCYHCNLGLGFFRDNPDVLDAARTYLLIQQNPI